jgi:hypothetical protein
MSISESQYTSLVDLPAGATFTIYLCPRSKTNGGLDDQTEGQYWESYCISQPFTTTLNITGSAPQVPVSSIEPATLLHPNQITIQWWSSFNYTDGQVIWGTLPTPSHVYSFQTGDRNGEPDYSGQYTATIPAGVGTPLIQFTVKTENNITNPNVWYSTTVAARPARNYHSLVQFLRASNVQLPTGVRQFLHGTSSLRSLMQI